MNGPREQAGPDPLSRLPAPPPAAGFVPPDLDAVGDADDLHALAQVYHAYAQILRVRLAALRDGERRAEAARATAEGQANRIYRALPGWARRGG